MCSILVHLSHLIDDRIRDTCNIGVPISWPIWFFHLLRRQLREWQILLLTQIRLAKMEMIIMYFSERNHVTVVGLVDRNNTFLLSLHNLLDAHQLIIYNSCKSLLDTIIVICSRFYCAVK